MTDQRARSLRIITAFTIVTAMIAAGWLYRSPWTVVLATPTFTVLYALGKWNAWTAAWRAGGLRQVTLALLVTLPIQAIVAGVCYLIGLGLGMLFAGNRPIAACRRRMSCGWLCCSAPGRPPARRSSVSRARLRWLLWLRCPSRNSSSIRRG